MDIPEYICSEINIPMCKAINVKHTTYGSRPGKVFFLEIIAPYTLCLLLASIILTVRMIRQVNTLYASIGRGEMKIIFYLYIISGILMSILISFEPYISKMVYSILSSLQLTFSTTMFFGIFVSGITIDRIYGIMRTTSENFMGSIVVLYFVVMQVFIFLSLFIGNTYVFIITTAINTMSLVLYTILQIQKLRKIKSDIWSYGVLGLVMIFYIFGIVNMCVGAKLIAFISERNLDSLFFNLLNNFVMVMMIHKYWLGTCDFEIECLTLEQ